MRERAEIVVERVVAARRHFHEYPELPWQEVETSRFIEERLRSLGLENVKRGFGGTESGVMADVVGTSPGRTVALRADIDALPLTEENDVPYRSKKSGVMHACGHDAHAAILLGVAEVLASMRDELSGRVRFLFQPAEEAGTNSGAPRMIEDGVLDGVDAIAGLHVWSPLPAGTVGLRSGPVMASADIWDLTIQGKGGHGAMPHRTVDPTITASLVVTALQTVVSREMDPLDTVVLSVGEMQSGTAMNIIPETARVAGSIRTVNRDVRSRMEGIVKRVADGICAAMRATAKLTFTHIYPVTVNDPALTEVMRSVAVDVAGEENVREVPVAMGSEDFSYYGEKVPATFFFLGIADAAKETDQQHHNPRFDAGDDVLGTGVAILAAFAAKVASGH